MKELKNPITINNWRGMFSLRGSHLIPDNYLSNAKNISCADGSISPFKMYSDFGNQLSSTGQITHSWTTVKADGTEIPLRIRDDATNSHVEWYESVSETWYALLPDQTTGLTYGFADFNTSTQDEVWWCNGTENMTLWIKETTYLTAAVTATDTTINVNSTTGFPSTGTIIYNGAEIAYSAKAATTFTVASAHASAGADDGVAIAADDSTYSALTKYNILLTADARMWGGSTSGVALAYSKVGDATDWTASTAPDGPGSIDLVEGEGGLTGLAAIRENIFVFKKDLVSIYKLLYPTSSTRTEELLEIKRGNSMGAVNQDGIEKVGEAIFYTTRKGGIKSVSISKLQEGFDFDDVTDLIRPTLDDGVFTSARLGYFEKKRVLLLAYKKDSDSTRNDRVVSVELIKDPELGAYKSLGIIDWFVGDWFPYGDKYYFGGSFEPNAFQAFDGYSKAGDPFTSIFTTKRYNFGAPLLQKEIPMIMMSGWISSGTTINFELDYDYAGTRAHLTSSLAGTESDYIIEPQLNMIGAFELGSEPIGGTISEISELNYFRVFFTLPPQHHPFDIQLNGYTDTEGARYKIEQITFDAVDAGFKIDSKLKKAFK